jgi:hypothetical protein
MEINHDDVGPSAEDIQRDLRQLALVDRVLGLEAEIARLSIAAPALAGPRAEIERLQNELNAAYGSRTWRVGAAVLAPLRILGGMGRSKKPSKR